MSDNDDDHNRDQDQDQDPSQDADLENETEQPEVHHIPIYPGVDLESWIEMDRKVKSTIKGNCTLIPIFDDPLNAMIQMFDFPPEALEEMFYPISSRICLNSRNKAYCVIQNHFNENGMQNRRDSAHKIIRHKTMDTPVIVILGNEIRDGKVVKNCNNSDPDVYMMAYHIMADDDLAQRALHLYHPLEITSQIFAQVMMSGQHLSTVPNIVMQITGLNIQQEVFDFLDDMG